MSAKGHHIVIQGHFLHHPFSGQGVFLEETLRAWSKHLDTHCTVLAWYRTPDQRERMTTVLAAFPRVSVRFVRLPSWLPFRLTLGIWEFLWIPFFLMSEKEGHVYFSPTIHPMAWHPRGKTRSISMVLHDALQFTEDEYNSGWSRKFYNALLRRTAKHPAVRLWTVSQTSREAIEKYVTRGKIVDVAGNGIDHLQSTTPAPWKPLAQRLGITGPYLLYQGGYDERKNVTAVVAAFRRLRQRHPDLRLVLCGNSLHASTLYANLQELAKEPGVIHTGFVDRSTLRTLFAKATALVSPSRAEGFNIVIGEALMEGTTVVASRIPAHEELWKDHALLVNFADEHATDALLELVLAGNLRSTPLSSSSLHSLSWDVQVGKIFDSFV